MTTELQRLSDPFQGLNDPPIWFVLVVEPQKEATVAFTLKMRGFTSYYPRQLRRIRSNYRKHRDVHRAMIPGYVFVNFDPVDNKWKSIPQITEVRRILSVEERPVPVLDSDLQFIRDAEKEANTPGKGGKPKLDCRIGNKVIVVNHAAFGGLPARVVQILDKQENVVVNVGLFKRQTRVVLSANQVRVV